MVRSEVGGRVTTTERDAFGRPVVITDPAGGRTRLTWSSSGLLEALAAPDETAQLWEHDGEGNLVRHVDGAGNVAHAEFGMLGTLRAIRKPDGTQRHYHYDDTLQLTGMTNELGLAWSYRLDAWGRVVEEEDFDGRRTAYERHAVGRVVRRTNAAGQSVETDYDILGNPVRVTAGEAVTTYRWGPRGELLAADGPGVSLERDVDALGRVLAETVNGATMRYTIDPAGRRVGRVTPGGVESVWQLDELGMPTDLVFTGRASRFARDELGRETSRSFVGGTVASAWDPVGRLLSRSVTGVGTEAQGRDVLQTTYGYARGGSLLWAHEMGRGRADFTRDAMSRVTQVVSDGLVNEAYAYDPAGNLLTAEWDAGHVGEAPVGGRSYRGTAVTQVGRDRLTYDPVGRLVTRRRPLLSGGSMEWSYTWDAHDRLVGVATPDGSRWTYTYDPLGRRVHKVETSAQATTGQSILFAWDGMRLAEQRTETGVTTTWEHLSWEPVAQVVTRGGDEPDGVSRAPYRRRHTRPWSPTWWAPRPTSSGRTGAPSGGRPGRCGGWPPVRPQRARSMPARCRCGSPGSTRTPRPGSTTTCIATTTRPRRATSAPTRLGSPPRPTRRPPIRRTRRPTSTRLV